jgi:hypothetical protein
MSHDGDTPGQPAAHAAQVKVAGGATSSAVSVQNPLWIYHYLIFFCIFFFF